jgi:hypothetical protein
VRLFRLARHGPGANPDYFRVSPSRRILMCSLYFALIAGLGIGMYFSRVEPPN